MFSPPRSGSDAQGNDHDRCERGDEDAGRYRLTFFHKNRRLRLVIDEEGNAIQGSKIE